ncbi:MAG: VOC family protein [Cyclobacteriaceae bacterium]|nr:VOC family protein [Cyclobacteriaceae bacterium HetDA_MAG_MS6]
MKRVTGIGGVFFKAEDPEKIRNWYKKHLGMDQMESWGMNFEWVEKDTGKVAQTVWSAFKSDTDYLKPSEKPFMINYRVEDLHAVLDQLRKEGVQVMENVEESEYGKFGWVLDPEGNKIELWEPPAV